MELTRIADNQTAAMAQGMLMKLRAAMPVLDWHRSQQNRAQVMARIQDMPYKDLPERCAKEVFRQECKRSYGYGDDYRPGGKHSVKVAASQSRILPITSVRLSLVTRITSIPG
jgi:hypothetical protein